MQKIIIIFVSLFAAASASAQYNPPTCTAGQALKCNNYPSYQYDAAGNRTSKYNFCWCAAVDGRLANNSADASQAATPVDTELHSTPVITATPPSFGGTEGGTTISRIYPNPSNSSITVFFSGSISKGTLSVSDGTGKQLEVFAVSSTEMKIDISTYPAGMYFLSLRTDTTIDTQRVIKVE